MSRKLTKRFIEVVIKRLVPSEAALLPLLTENPRRLILGNVPQVGGLRAN